MSSKVLVLWPTDETRRIITTLFQELQSKYSYESHLCNVDKLPAHIPNLTGAQHSCFGDQPLNVESS